MRLPVRVSSVCEASRRLVVAFVLVVTVPPAAAQATCGAAGGAPAGSSVCDYRDEAIGVASPSAPAGAGNPIDLVTGNKYRRELDVEFPAKLPFVFARHYNSRNRHMGVMGVGWSHSFEARLAEVRAGGRKTLQVLQNDGRRLVFERDRQRPTRWRTREPSEGWIDALEYQGARFWRWYVPGERQFAFDEDGQAISVERIGHHESHLIMRRQDGSIETILTGGSETARFEYHEHAKGLRLVALETYLGRIEWTYDEAGQLESTRWPNGLLHRYRYDDPHDPLLLTSVSRRAPQSDAPEVEIARYAYDTQGRAIRTWEDGGDSLTLDWSLPRRRGERGATTVTDATGRAARYTWTYDRLRHRGQILEATGIACGSCPPAPRQFDYDAAGRLVGVRTPDDAWRLERDALGRPTAAWRRAAGRTEPELLWRAGYGARDTLNGWTWLEQPSIAPGRWHRIELERDALGRVIAVSERGWAPRVDATDARSWRAISRRFAFEHPPEHSYSWRSVFDRNTVQYLAVDGPEPGSTDRIEVQPSALGPYTEVVWPYGMRERISFDGGAIRLHWPLTEQSLVLDSYPATDERKSSRVAFARAELKGRGSIEFENDETGRFLRGVRQVPAAGRSTELRLDFRSTPDPQTVLATWRGRATRVALPDGSIFTRGFDDFARVVWIDEPDAPRQWADYDATDRLVEHRPGDGSVLVYRRDAVGRLVEATRTDANGTTLLGRYTWDRTWLVEASNDTVSIRYEYDRFGRLATVEHGFSDGTRSLRWHWKHDEDGAFTWEILPDGRVICYERRDGRIVAVRIDDTRLDVARLSTALSLRTEAGPQAPPDRSSLRFSGARLVEAAGVRHVVDPHGRRAAKQPVTDASSRRSRSFVHHDWRLRAEQDAQGRLRQWIWADDRPVAYLEDGRVFSVVTDARGAPVRAMDPSGRTVWQATYDRNGSAQVRRGSVADVPLRLPGQYHDAETGLHYNHRRTYEPMTGRYLERDPLGLQPDWTSRDDMTLYAGGDPIGHTDPWGLARLTYVALTTDTKGRPIGQQRGFEQARWSLLIEDIEPVQLAGATRRPPQPVGIDRVIFDPWGDFVTGYDLPESVRSNGVDAIAVTGVTGRGVFASFAAHYRPSLADAGRFVIDGFDDRRAGALALILSATPSDRSACIGQVLQGLPFFSPTPGGLPVAVTPPPPRPPSPNDPPPPPGITRLLSCAPLKDLPITYQDDTERWRVERLQAAAELQESPGARLNHPCRTPLGCASGARLTINGHAYTASYGRTQFTVTTFLSEIVRLAVRPDDRDARALRTAIGLDRPIVLDGRPATVRDALLQARERVDAAFRAYADLRKEFAAPRDAESAARVWDDLPASRQARFTAETGLGRREFLDMLSFNPTGRALSSEEARHAIAAAATTTVRWSVGGQQQSFDDWLIGLYSSRDPYDHLSRAFLRDNLRRVLAAPSLQGRFDNTEAPGSIDWQRRQRDIELELAQRVAVLHNSGNLRDATQADIGDWLQRLKPNAPIKLYVNEFTNVEARGDWESLRCAPGLQPGRNLWMRNLADGFGLPAGQNRNASPGRANTVARH